MNCTAPAGRTGTQSGYCNGCRCLACREAHRIANKQWRAKAPSPASRYRYGDRDDEARAARAAKERERLERRRKGLPPRRPGPSAERDRRTIHCGECSLEVVYCEGRYGDWMHAENRRELGDDGHLARPETYEQVQQRLAQKEQVA